MKEVNVKILSIVIGTVCVFPLAALAADAPSAPEPNGVITDKDVQAITALNSGAFLNVKMADGSSHPFIDGAAVLKWAQDKLTEAKTAEARAAATAKAEARKAADEAAKAKEKPLPAPVTAPDPAEAPAGPPK